MSTPAMRQTIANVRAIIKEFDDVESMDVHEIGQLIGTGAAASRKYATTLRDIGVLAVSHFGVPQRNLRQGRPYFKMSGDKLALVKLLADLDDGRSPFKDCAEMHRPEPQEPAFRDWLQITFFGPAKQQGDAA